ncbi:outer membrane beta-barrel family protein [Flagellimonas zhangzhouensis]|uniref:Outer membrane receptor proteins, mostly Fe transport n=1 Tax=Flagellimonas zhangzhouensis TaxID=1073328 RepID=A0A1H2ZA05_9FLAO|nr:outer membrane beta-barrel family protein [Allomuricauda zhangzhouensis]SDR08288.1 Outer membrane receptor proteins, mostly Fe transport [Allomuricauda zhangzhouensis]SDX14147.1 Outer membrane receptor proteins, mostly Fe transport [Allomuricauda zhangzhouensis]
MRRMSLLFALLLCTIFTNTINANGPDDIGSINGTVIDNTLKEPVAYASVVIKSEDGTQTITGGITTDDGKFEVGKLADGTYLVEVQYIGYKTYSKKLVITKGKRKLDLGTITLEEQSQQLEGVEVVAERTTIEQRVDRKVINVGKDLTTSGATASEIMNNIPSVNVDAQTGDLTLRGNSNVRVMVDGKLSNIPVAQLLKQIPSTSIKSIELITNPSAKYNPEGMSGIINIVLHKNANIGFNGNINLGLTKGEEAKFNTSLDLNYRNGKFNFYGNYGNNVGKWVNDGSILRVDENSRQKFDFFNNNKSNLYKLGVDFYLNDKNTISFFTNQNLYDGKGDGTTQVSYFNDPSRNVTQYLYDESDNHSQQYNFDYKMDFNKEGHNIELEVDHNIFNSGQDANFRSTGASTYPDYMDFVDTERTQTIANLDYVNPLDSISKLEIGVESRNFETKVDYASTGQTFNSSGNLVSTPSTKFVYAMDIYSAYATFGQTYKKWSYQVGARIENVEVQADTNAVRSFTDKYTEIYPSAFVTFSPNEKDQLQVSYSRRVDRPGLGQVNPIREFATPLISSFGNPELVPQFTSSYEANYTKRIKNGSVTGGVFYRSISDEINRAIYVDRLDLNKTILTYDNFDKTSAYGIEVSYNYKPIKWWSINGSFDLFSQTQRGITETLNTTDPNPTEDDIVQENVEVDNTAWNLRMNNSFTVTKKLSLQAFGFYRGRNKSIQFDAQPMYFVNLGARYSFAEGKGTLSLNYNDIFNTMRFAFEGDYPYEQEGAFNWESNNIYVGASYRFGSGKNRAKQRKRRDSNTKQGGGGIL